MKGAATGIAGSSLLGRWGGYSRLHGTARTSVAAQVILLELCLTALSTVLCALLLLPAEHALRHARIHKHAGVLVQPCVGDELLQQGAKSQRQEPQCVQVPAQGE